MENAVEELKIEINETLTELDVNDIDFDYETELLEKLPRLIVKKAQLAVSKITPKFYEELTPKQQEFYLDIHAFLKKWIDEHIEAFLNMPYEDQINVLGEEIKITIKRIEELMTTRRTKKDFTTVVDEFGFIKDGGRFSGTGKHEHLRDDFIKV